MERIRLILFVGVYDTLDIFTYELQKTFEQAFGCETMLYDVREPEKSLTLLAQFIQKPVKAVLTFNNLGFNMELHAGKNIWEELQIPCINILMDHPFCYPQALAQAPYNSVVLCPDRNHMKYIQRFYPRIPITGFLPHAGKEIAAVRKPIADRSIDVLYAGGLSRDFAKNVMPDFSKYQTFDARKLCEAAYYDLLAHPWKTTEQALEEMLKKEGIALDDVQLREVIADLHVVDLYVTSYYREKTIRTLVEQGINVVLYGNGWDHCEWIGNPHVYYGGRISADEVVLKMQDARIVLSTMTWFKDGTHDRVFNGMLQGALAVSDTSGYMEEEFCGMLREDGTDERELLLFQLEEIGQLPMQIKELLADPARMQRIADRGYKKAHKAHTWAARAEEIYRDLLECL